MRKKTKGSESWVVYSMLAGQKPDGGNSVCSQEEWDEMEKLDPGRRKLIRTGISNEPEAEKLAREAPGGTALKIASRFRARP